MNQNNLYWIYSWPGILAFMLLIILARPALALDRVSLEDGTEIAIERFQADGGSLLVWLPSEAGYQDSEAVTAAALAGAGIEVWVPDLLEARFLPLTQSNLDRIPASDVAALLDAASASGKKVFLVSSGRSVIPGMRGARQWLLAKPARPLFGGIIMLSPKFYLETPEPGMAGELLPVVSHSNLPLYLVQPDHSPWFWKLEQTLPALQQGGSDVYLRIVKDARDRFYFRPDANELEQSVGEQLPSMIRQAMRMLSFFAATERKQPALSLAEPEVRSSKKERVLRSYAGDAQPPTLVLPDMRDNMHDLQDYRGQVVMLNFWASWCPPCVYEMPSMQRLQDQLRDRPFKILAVNMAETKPVIRQFLQEKVNVQFPVLLDSDGAALKRWRVFAFPTTFLIDKQGRIRYALFGGREWDTPDVIDVINELLGE
jgi:thiol-disulfide isomerase/thioredoxin